MGIRGKLGAIKRFAVNVKKDGLTYTLDKRDYNKRKAVQPFTDIDYEHWKKQHKVEGKLKKDLIAETLAMKESGPVFVAMVDILGATDENVAVTRKSLASQVYRPIKVYYGSQASMGDKLAEYYNQFDCDLWVVKIPAGDVLAADFFFRCAKKIVGTNADICYTDHEIISEGQKNKVCLKPDFSEDYLCAYDYIGKAFVAKNREPETMNMSGYSYLLKKLAEKSEFCHAASCVYEQRIKDENYILSEEDRLNIKKVYSENDKYSVTEVMVENEEGINRVSLAWKETPEVTVIIPNKDHTDDLEKALSSLKKQNIYNRLQVLVVENNSTEQKTLDYYKTLEKESNIEVLYWPDGFNYSAINNFAEKNAKGEFIVLMNNDVELIGGDVLERMLAVNMLDRVGMVGIKLYYEDDSIQHAGVVVGFQGVGGHTFTGLKKGDHGYMNMADCPRRVSAVTAACLMMSKEIYDEVGGLDERYAVAFNDVDLCMKVCESGKQIIYLPVTAYHFESKTRGNDTTEEQVARFGQEVTTFLATWQDKLKKGDPYYNANKSLNDMSEDRFRDIYSEDLEN